MSNREIVLRAFSNRVGNLYKQAEEGDTSESSPIGGIPQNAIMKALSGVASGAKGYLGNAMSKSQDATMAALGRFKELDPTAQAAILGGLGGAGVGGIGNAVLGNKKKSLIRRLGEGAGVGAAAGAGAGALGGVIGKNKDKLLKGVGKAKDKVVAEAGKVGDKAKGLATSAKEQATSGVNYLSEKAKALQEAVMGKLTGKYPNQDMYEGEGDPISRASEGLSGTRNEDANKGLSRLLANPAEPAPFLPDEAGISQNLKSIGRQRNPNMNLGDFPSRGRSEG